MQISDNIPSITNINAETNNGRIEINWDSSYVFDNKQIQVIVSEIVNAEEKIVEEYLVPIKTNHISFTSGSHSSLYKIVIDVVSKDGEVLEKGIWSSKRLFISYDLLPDIPLVEINTVDGEEPTCSYVSAPEGAVGKTIVDNDYKIGRISIRQNNTINYNGNVNIRIRGNSSAYGEKKPYKIELDSAVNLLDDKNAIATKEWCLLNSGTNFNTYVAYYIAKQCEMECQLQMEFVNLMVNGDWKGCYILTQAVSYDTMRNLVDEDGFIFEFDAYWWSSDDVHYRTNPGYNNMAYTFKYPTLLSMDDDRFVYITDYLLELATGLADNTYHNYMDVESFAKWMLARDIVGGRDPCGTNLYFYKESDNDNDVIKMGPMWDFDSIFNSYGEWSSSRVIFDVNFPELLSKVDFENCYTTQWDKISKELQLNVENELNNLVQERGEALNESYRLDAVRYETTYSTVENVAEPINAWFISRTEWIDEQLKQGDICIE